MFFAWSAPAQEALRLSLTGQDAAAARHHQLENQPYTIRWGDLKLLAGASLAGDWNDNVNLSQSNPRQDFIIRPVANLNVFWPVTDLNSLSFSLGAGYEKFLQHGEYDRELITPGSQLAWDIFIQNFRINLHDWFSYQEDPTIWGGATGTARFGGFHNTVGFLASWDLHDVVLSFGYDHLNFIATPSQFDYQTRASDFGVVRAGFQVHPSATVGLEASAGPTAYQRPLLSDNFMYSVGAYADCQATEHLQLQPRGGYYQYSFSDNGLMGRNSDQSGYYVSLKLIHDLKWNINYTLTGGHESFLGNQSSLTEQWYGALSINWRALKHVSLGTSFRYENASQQLGNNYDRLYTSLRLACPIMPKLTASLEYRYWLRNGELAATSDYTQNRLTLQLAYNF